LIPNYQPQSQSKLLGSTINNNNINNNNNNNNMNMKDYRPSSDLMDSVSPLHPLNLSSIAKPIPSQLVNSSSNSTVSSTNSNLIYSKFTSLCKLKLKN